MDQSILFRAGMVFINSFPGFSGDGEVYLNSSPPPEKYLHIYTSPAPKKFGNYLETPFRRRSSIYTHFSDAEEVFIYTYLASEKPEKYLYTPHLSNTFPGPK